MKVRLAFVFAVLFCFNHVWSQTPPWHWARSGATSGTEMALDVTTDASSTDIYVSGSFDGNLNSVYGSSLTASAGGRDGFLLKYDVLGNLLWGFSIGGTANDEIVGVSTDPFGNVYALGTFSGTCDFDPSASQFILNANARDGFLAKYNSAGACLWAVKFGSALNDNAWGIEANANGVYITGSVAGIATFSSASGGTSILNTQGNEDMFGAKFNFSGTLQWCISQGASGTDIGYEVTADNNNVYFIGTYNNNCNLYNSSGTQVASLSSQQSGVHAVVISAYTQAGAYLWSNNITSSDNNYGLGISQDTNNLFITGSISSLASFRYPSPSFTKSTSATDIFVAKLAKVNGTFAWASSQTGSGNGYETGYDIKVNRNTVLVSGIYASTLDYQAFGGSLLNASATDPFLTCFDLSGNYLWNAAATGSTSDLCLGLAVNNSGGIFVCGSYGAGINFGNIGLSPANNANIFVAKLGCDSILGNLISPLSQTICSSNNPAIITGAFSAGANYSIQWQTSANGTSWSNAPNTSTNAAYSSSTLSASAYFRRVISASGTCTNSLSSPTVFVKVDQLPQANAGGDVYFCTKTLTLNVVALSPSAGTGTWSVVSGAVFLSAPNSPTAMLSNLPPTGAVLQWAVSNGVCPVSISTISINSLSAVPQAVGGSNQHVCAITATLSATTPSAGVGFWSVLSGSASFITTSISSATVAIGTGTNSFLWTVTNGVCPATYDTVFVVADPLPPPAYANKDQTICSKNTTLNATPVSGGSSSWQLISGSGLISNTVTNSTTVDSLAIGKNVFRWTVQIGMCPSSFDEVTIWREVPGNIAFAGNNQQVEIPVAQLSASVPVVGKGYWQVLQGTGVIENDSIAMTKINGLSIGTNQLRWTVTNGTCPTSTSDLLIYLDGLKIPNGFSPNGDGVNDTFVIPGLEYYAPADFSVFNRWGALVYHNAAYRNEWNGGNMNNSLLTDDTYYFTLNISKELNFNGYIIIKAAK